MYEQNNYSEPNPVIQESLQTKEDGEKNKVPERTMKIERCQKFQAVLKIAQNFSPKPLESSIRVPVLKICSKIELVLQIFVGSCHD